MGRIASGLGSLTVAVLVTAAGLAFKFHVLLIIAVALGCAAFVFWWLDYRMRPDRRVFLEENVNIEFLTGLFVGRTTIQAENATKIYIGKWMKYIRTLRDVKDGFGGRLVMFEEHLSPMAEFSKREAKLQVLQPGDILQIQGRLKRITSHWIRLEKCELLSVEPRNIS